MVTYAALKHKASTVTITTEMKIQLTGMLDTLVQYVDLAIWETEALSENWDQIHLDLGLLHTHASEADADQKIDVFKDITCVLTHTQNISNALAKLFSRLFFLLPKLYQYSVYHKLMTSN